MFKLFMLYGRAESNQDEQVGSLGKQLQITSDKDGKKSLTASTQTALHCAPLKSSIQRDNSSKLTSLLIKEHKAKR